MVPSHYLEKLFCVENLAIVVKWIESKFCSPLALHAYVYSRLNSDTLFIPLLLVKQGHINRT
jgi:hypothetical protein